MCLVLEFMQRLCYISCQLLYLTRAELTQIWHPLLSYAQRTKISCLPRTNPFKAAPGAYHWFAQWNRNVASPDSITSWRERRNEICIPKLNVNTPLSTCSLVMFAGGATRPHNKTNFWRKTAIILTRCGIYTFYANSLKIGVIYDWNRTSG